MLFILLNLLIVTQAMTLGQYESEVQNIIDKYANFLKNSYQVSVTHQNYNNTFVSGVQDHAKGTKLTRYDLIPLGSMIKPYTAMSVIRLIQEGKIGFNDTVASHIDPILKSGNGAKLLELWGGNELVNNVTIYQLLHMRSGIADYNDE